MKAPARLRPLGISAVLPDERIALFDPLGLSPSASRGTLVLEAWEWETANAFDGRRAAAELAGTGRDARSAAARVERVQALAERLSRENVLEDEHFDRALAREFDSFRRNERRPASGAGSEYPADPFDLRLRLGGVVADDWDMPPLDRVTGLWAPGGPLPAAASLYGRAWASVRHTTSRFERVVLLGSVGAPLEHQLVPLAKPFETPLGTLEIDREALTHLGVLPGRAQLAHRTSNVIERQALFVRLLFPRARIVPILVGALDPETDPAEDEGVLAALEGLERVERLPGTLFVACADLFHQSRPGGVHPVATGSDIADQDRRMLDAVEALDPVAFAAAGLTGADHSRAAQAAAPYLLIALLRAAAARRGDELRATNLGYLQCPTPSALFTAAAAVFHGGPAA